MYQPYQHRPRKIGSYFLPFLSIIILGLIVVLVFQIVDYFQEKRIQALENKASVQIVAGRAEMKIWGVPDWTSVINGSLLHEGDAIRTAPGSRVILTLLNGSVVRLSSETEIEMTGLKTRDAQDEAEIILKQGNIWLKRSENETVMASFKVATQHFEIDSMGTVFAVSKDVSESVRVLDGKVRVYVKVEDGDSMRTAETLEVALGQEVTIGTKEISALQQRKSVQLLALLSDDFRSDDWYAWNRNEDKTGAVGISVADAVSKTSGQTSLPQAPQPAQTEEAAPVEVESVLSAPEILAPKPADRKIKTSSVEISGAVSPQTEKIEITTYLADKAEAYVLRKYKAGEEKWSYVASREYGNLAPGENKFTVVAIGRDGKRSDPAEITIFYDRPAQPADLSDPVVLSFNGGSSNETTEDVVKVEGKVGKGIIKVFVDDFALTRYVPDSGKWTYYAKTAYGNLKEGENEYSVYGIDFDGNKTPVAKFSIKKNPKPGESAPPAPL